MIHWEYDYLSLIDRIITFGHDRQDRTGVGTRALFGEKLVVDLNRGFPAMTTKKLAWRAVSAELLWFLEGSNDERRLAEILHETRSADKKTIWTDNAQSDYWKPHAKFEGDLGRVYGVQWRRWQSYKLDTSLGKYIKDQRIDQLQRVIDTIRSNPTDRRLIVSAWNVAEIDQMALPPCHLLMQFFVSDGQLSCQYYQRSVDVMLGLPFNIASYALLTHLIAHVCGLGVGRLHACLGDTHIYSNHLDGAKLQLEREPFDLPALTFNRKVSSIDDFKLDDFELINYQHHRPIKLEMAV
jgi:thymidylate synthase